MYIQIITYNFRKWIKYFRKKKIIIKYKITTINVLNNHFMK